MRRDVDTIWHRSIQNVLELSSSEGLQVDELLSGAGREEQGEETEKEHGWCWEDEDETAFISGGEQTMERVGRVGFGR